MKRLKITLTTMTGSAAIPLPDGMPEADAAAGRNHDVDDAYSGGCD